MNFLWTKLQSKNLFFISLNRDIKEIIKMNLKYTKEQLNSMSMNKLLKLAKDLGIKNQFCTQGGLVRTILKAQNMNTILRLINNAFYLW